MTFLLNYLYSVICAYCLRQHYAQRKLSSISLFILLFPIFSVWLFICGGQCGVGTDYGSYLYIFEGNLDDFFEKHEYLFAGIVSFFNACGIYGQGLFYIFYAINFFFLFLVLKRFRIEQVYLFILLYITVTGLFNNQLNGLRQSTAIYVGTYAAFLIFENKSLKAAIFIVLATLIHQSAIILLFLYVFKYILRHSSFAFLFVLLFIAICLSLTLQITTITFLLPYLPEEYAWYILDGGVEERTFISKITKYIYIPLYLFSWRYFYKHRLSVGDNILFKIGWIAFCLRLSVINLTIISRIADYFLLLSILPLLLYLYCLYKTRNLFLFISIIFFLSIFYCLKVTVFARGEYLYNSIYF